MIETGQIYNWQHNETNYEVIHLDKEEDYLVMKSMDEDKELTIEAPIKSLLWTHTLVRGNNEQGE